MCGSINDGTVEASNGAARQGFRGLNPCSTNTAPAAYAAYDVRASVSADGCESAAQSEACRYTTARSQPPDLRESKRANLTGPHRPRSPAAPHTSGNIPDGKAPARKYPRHELSPIRVHRRVLEWPGPRWVLAGLLRIQKVWPSSPPS